MNLDQSYVSVWTPTGYAAVALSEASLLDALAQPGCKGRLLALFTAAGEQRERIASQARGTNAGNTVVWLEGRVHEPIGSERVLWDSLSNGKYATHAYQIFPVTRALLENFEANQKANLISVCDDRQVLLVTPIHSS